MPTIIEHGQRVRIPFAFKGKVVATPTVEASMGEVALINTNESAYEVVWTPDRYGAATVSAVAQVDRGDGAGAFEYAINLGEYSVQATADVVTVEVGEPIVEDRPEFRQIEEN